MSTKSSPTEYGLIGLGNVGGHLAAAALSSGLSLHTYDLSEERLERTAALGAEAHEDAASVAQVVDVLVMSLPTAESVDDALLHSGAIDRLRPGALLIDMSTNLPERAVALAEEGERRSLRVLDSPVSFGPNGLVAFVGGVQASVDAAHEWLDTVTAHAHWVGPNGHGQNVKLIQNILTGVGMGVVAEVISLAERTELNLDRLLEALRWTGANSGLLESTLPAMAERRYGSNGAMALHSKDMGYALQVAGQVGADLPFTTVLQRIFEDVLTAGDGQWNQIALIEWFSDHR